jgi:hypothetical protein
MLDTRKQWFRDFPWEMIVEKNKSLCQRAEIAAQFTGTYKSACELWENAFSRALTLQEALETCRRCHAIGPFRFYNSPTFATMTPLLVADFIQTLPPVEAEMLRNTVRHYVVGGIDRKELGSVFRYFEEPASNRKTFWQRIWSFFERRKPGSSDHGGVSASAPLAKGRNVRSPEVSGN